MEVEVEVEVYTYEPALTLEQLALCGGSLQW